MLREDLGLTGTKHGCERGEGGGFVPRTYPVDTEERPPMREIAEYAARNAA